MWEVSFEDAASRGDFEEVWYNKLKSVRLATRTVPRGNPACTQHASNVQEAQGAHPKWSDMNLGLYAKGLEWYIGKGWGVGRGTPKDGRGYREKNEQASGMPHTRTGTRLGKKVLGKNIQSVTYGDSTHLSC